MTNGVIDLTPTPQEAENLWAYGVNMLTHAGSAYEALAAVNMLLSFEPVSEAALRLRKILDAVLEHDTATKTKKWNAPIW